MRAQENQALIRGQGGHEPQPGQPTTPFPSPIWAIAVVCNITSSYHSEGQKAKHIMMEARTLTCRISSKGGRGSPLKLKPKMASSTTSYCPFRGPAACRAPCKHASADHWSHGTPGWPGLDTPHPRVEEPVNASRAMQDAHLHVSPVQHRQAQRTGLLDQPVIQGLVGLLGVPVHQCEPCMCGWHCLCIGLPAALVPVLLPLAAYVEPSVYHLSLA